MGALDKNIDTMSGLTGILTTLLGKKGGTQTDTTSGGTETKQTQLDVGAMMKQLLEGAGTAGYGKAGLAHTLTSGKRAGVYGGKSTELNLNDLLSRITTEASIAGAPTTVNRNPSSTTRSGVGSQAGMVSGAGAGLGALALLAGSKSGKKAIKDMWDSLGTSNIPSEPLGGSFGDSGMLGSAADWGLPDSAAGAGDAASFGNADMLGTSADWGFDAVDSFSSFGDAGSFGDADILGSSADWGFDAAGSAGDATGTPIGAGLKILSGDVQGGVESGIGYAIGSMTPLGPIGGAIGSAIAEPVFEAASDIVQTIGDLGDSLICTELHRQGILPTHIYYADSAFGKTLPITTVRGYHLFARPYVRLMTKSKTATWAASVLALPWANEMAYRMGTISKGNKFGAFLLWTGVPFFSMLDLIVNGKELANG
jgi:hypothetical protein